MDQLWKIMNANLNATLKLIISGFIIFPLIIMGTNISTINAFAAEVCSDCDTDGDSVLDIDEDLNSNNDVDDDDTDADGIPDYLDVDDDNDGILTIEEAYIDVDNDGILDHLDDCMDVDDDGLCPLCQPSRMEEIFIGPYQFFPWPYGEAHAGDASLCSALAGLLASQSVSTPGSDGFGERPTAWIPALR